MRLATAVPYMQAGSEPQTCHRGPCFTAIPPAPPAPGPQFLSAAVLAARVQTPRLERAQQPPISSPSRLYEVPALQRSARPSGQTSAAPLVTPRPGGRPHSPSRYHLTSSAEEGLDRRDQVPEEVGDSARVRALLQELQETRRERDDLRRERDALLHELRGARTREPAVPPLPMGSNLPSRGSLHSAGGSPFGQEDTVEVLVSVPRAFTSAELQEAAQESYGQTPRGDVMSQYSSAAPVLAGVQEDM